MSELDIKLDFEREQRTGIEEAILCEYKSHEQIVKILLRVHTEARSVLLTRLTEAQYADIPADYKTMMDYEPISKTAYFNWQETALGEAEIAIVTAGTSDVPVAREALRTLRYNGMNATTVFDVGVAGIWRLLDRIEEIRQFPVLIVSAGMDAALPTVLGGLYDGLIIAVPTSVGYGVATGGTTALNSILASCAPGVVTVNIDNGYGAACAALKTLRAVAKN